jgi:hypothetical protein
VVGEHAWMLLNMAVKRWVRHGHAGSNISVHGGSGGLPGMALLACFVMASWHHGSKATHAIQRCLAPARNHGLVRLVRRTALEAFGSSVQHAVDTQKTRGYQL